MSPLLTVTIVTIPSTMSSSSCVGSANTTHLQYKQTMMYHYQLLHVTATLHYIKLQIFKVA